MMKKFVYFLIWLTVLCYKAVAGWILWNYVILDMFKLQTLSIGQALIAALCIASIVIKVKIKD